MSTFGKIEEFMPGKEKFSDYEERLYFYFEANGVEDDRKNELSCSQSLGLASLDC